MAEPVEHPRMLAGARLFVPAVLLALLGAGVARAQPMAATVDLLWNAPSDCPSREGVLGEVARLLAASRTPPAQARAQADVTRDEQGRWHAALSVDARGAHGERTLDAEGCPAIASATALIIAVAVEGGMPPPQATAPPAPTPPVPPPATSPRRQSASQLIVAAAGVVDTAILAEPNPGGEATLGWMYRGSQFAIRAIASATLFANQPVVTAGGERGQFMPFGASARICASIVEGAFDVGPCVGGELDIMWARALGPTPPLTLSSTQTTQTGLWGSALGSVFASWSFSRPIAVFLQAGGLVSLLPPEFGISQSPDIRVHVLTPSPVGARGELGLEMHFF